MHDCRLQLDLLRELALILEKTPDAEAALGHSLRLLAKRLKMMRGSITIINPADHRIRISAAYGLNPSQMRRGEYLPGEGVTGKVIASGKAMCISDVSKEPLFLNRTRSRNLARESVSFVCAPIIFAGEAVGALSVDQLLTDTASLEEELGLLTVIATMLAPFALEGRGELFSADSRQDRPEGFIGNSEAMRQVYAQIAQVAPSQLSVFLRGESGTGKELAAHAIHTASNRSKGPFISLNCAALPENLIESELFGHEKGAFTGATQTRKGRFELADGGTLFLDEIGELSFLTQAKLLRVLQEHCFERLGGMHSQKVDVRVIAATNRNLEQMVAEGSFRRDLFYRLNVFPIFLPALRDRLEDVPALAEYFLRKAAALVGGKRPRISMACMDILQRYNWPGNIRELQNIMERAVLLLGAGKTVLPAHLPENMRNLSSDGKVAAAFATPGSLAAKLAEVEKASILAALESSCGHIGKAAKMLGVTERILSLRLARYHISYKDFREKRGG